MVNNLPTPLYQDANLSVGERLNDRISKMTLEALSLRGERHLLFRMVDGYTLFALHGNVKWVFSIYVDK